MGEIGAGDDGGLAGFDPEAVYDAAARDYAAVARRWWGFVAEQSVRSLRLAPGERVLDAACGTGLATLSAARRVGPEGVVLGVDYAEGMLAVARAAAEELRMENVELRRGDITALDPSIGRFDAVVCSLGIFFADDMPGALAGLWARVRAGGRMAIGVFGREVFAPLLDAFRAAVAAERPDLRVAPPWERVPDAATLAGLLEEAGVAGATIAEVRRPTPLLRPEEWWRVVIGSGLRHYVEQIGPDAAARVRQRNLAAIREREVDALAMSALVAVAEKGKR